MPQRKDDHPPWIIRTYAGFGGAEESNQRFRENLKSGQAGLSVAFDLPTQNGFDPDAPIAKGEIGGTGVSVAHLGDMQALFEGISPADINTSMTINSTAPFILALYLVLAEQNGIESTRLRGTVQNDLLKEFVARGTSIFNPEVSLRLSTDLITFTAENVPLWNPVNVCGYHYMESGAEPDEEIGYAFANAMILLDTVRPKLTETQFDKVVRRISFFINSGIELIPEICKMRAYAALWTRICRDEYGIKDVPFRSGCQVRSVSLPADQPENNIIRITLEALPALLSARGRVNALQLPGFREALSLPDKMEQTLSIRTQQILMHETGISEYGDIFDGNPVITNLTEEISSKAWTIASSLRAAGYGVAIERIDTGLTDALLEKHRRIERQEDIVVGVNAFQDPVGLSEQLDVPRTSAPDPGFIGKRCKELEEWRASRDAGKWKRAGSDLADAVNGAENIMPATIAFAKAGGTVGEWSTIIEKETGGRYSLAPSLKGFAPGGSGATGPSKKKGRIVLAKSGLDGHTNGVKLLAIALRDAGVEVIYSGPGIEPAVLMKIAVEEDADAVAVSSLSGAHLHIAREMVSAREELAPKGPRIIMGGIIPSGDQKDLSSLGIDLVVSDTSLPIQSVVGRILEKIQSD